LLLLYGSCHSQNTAKLIIYTGSIFLREREVILTDNNAMRWSIIQTTLDGPQPSSVSRFLQFEVLYKITSVLADIKFFSLSSCTAFCLSYFPLTGTDAYPSIMDLTEDITSSMECGKPTLLSFSAREVSDGTLFKTILDYDPQSKALLHQLEK
jgi:hypothetical protein